MRQNTHHTAQVYDSNVAPSRVSMARENSPPGTSLCRRGNTLKAILITLAIVCGVAFVLCAGLGVAGYFWLQRSMAQLNVSDPVKVRELTVEMIDIELPNELQPINAMSFLGTRFVAYHWCPSGTCDESESPAFTLVCIPDFSDGKNNLFDMGSATDEALNDRFHHYTKTIHEIEIHGRKYPFTFAVGDEKSDDEMPDESSEDLEVKPLDETESDPNFSKPESSEPTTSGTGTPAIAKPDASASPTAEGRKTWWISGDFPGKKGHCKLDLRLKADQYDETKILTMLRSIR